MTGSYLEAAPRPRGPALSLLYSPVPSGARNLSIWSALSCGDGSSHLPHEGHHQPLSRLVLICTPFASMLLPIECCSLPQPEHGLKSDRISGSSQSSLPSPSSRWSER